MAACHPSYDRPLCGPGDTCPSGLFCVAGICERSPGDDAGATEPDGATGRLCLGTFVKVCVDSPPLPLSLTAPLIDTSVSPICLSPGAYSTTPAVDACVIAGQSIAISSSTMVSATGARRLILLASESITIGGILDAASHHTGRRGPAADTGPCPANFTNPTVSGEGGGGWGGSFGGVGANGGSTPGGGIGGIAASVSLVTAFGGGCAGGDGAGTNGGDGGHGGGAVLLLAGQTVEISGTVNASGAGGSGGKANAGGGGGGGAGGMVVLEAPTVNILGRCLANGGGGGEGGSGAAAGGSDGSESTAPDLAGSGGANGTLVGGNGGGGGIASIGSTGGGNGTSIGNPVPDSGGGGGGGGGVGVIKVIAASQQGTADPSRVSPRPESD